VSLAVAALCGAATAWAPNALGAEVSVTETSAYLIDQTAAELSFEAAAGESNQVTITVAGGEGEIFDLEVVDAGAALTAGAGCSGGGAAGTPAICKIHRPRYGEIVSCGKYCTELVPWTGWTDTISATLDDEGDSFDASTLTSSVQGESFEMSVNGGPGADRILTGSGNDTVEPGQGDDEVRTADAHDWVVMEPVADGNDVIDLGGQPGDTIDYSARSEALQLHETIVEAAGETDTVTGFQAFIAGSGDDVLHAPSFFVQMAGRAGDDLLVGNETANSTLYGGPGEDTIRGGPGNNTIEGGSGDDLLYGEGGTNRIFENHAGTYSLQPSLHPPFRSPREEPADGNDVAYGGPGHDHIRLGTGADRIEGDGGDDTLYGEGGDDIVSGGSGDDKVAGGAGTDSLQGGPGDDTLFAAGTANPANDASNGSIDFASDRADCGPGQDLAHVTHWDEAIACEQIERRHLLTVRRPVARGQVWFWLASHGGHLVVFGPGVEKLVTDVGDGGLVQIRVRPRVWRRLARAGRAVIRLRVRFSPAGEPRRAEGQAVTIRRTIHRKHRHHSRRRGAVS